MMRGGGGGGMEKTVFFLSTKYFPFEGAGMLKKKSPSEESCIRVRNIELIFELIVIIRVLVF